MVQQIVLPIKDSNVLKMVQDTLLDSFRAGRRNYTIFQVGKATLLRVSDVMKLKKSDIFNLDGTVKQTAFIHDQKTGKANRFHPSSTNKRIVYFSFSKFDKEFFHILEPIGKWLCDRHEYHGHKGFPELLDN